MSEQTIVRKVKQFLDFGTESLEHKTVVALQKARAKALSRLEEREPVTGLAWAGHEVAQFVHLPHFGARFWVLVTALVMSLMAMTYWQQQENGNTGEIDTLLLADDLPPHAYLDKRFEAWLKHSQE